MQIEQCHKLSFDDLLQLKKYYMPFIKGGGVFIVTATNHALHEEINLQITLPNCVETFNVYGKVVWINPAFAQYGREQGVGVSINNEMLQNKIETLLAVVIDQTIETVTL